MSTMMTPYLELLHQVYFLGKSKSDRTGTGTNSLFGSQMEFDLSKGFPLLQEKSTPLGHIIRELLWMLNGCTNILPLTSNNVHIWDAWADAEGNLGPIYGKQWRDVTGSDGQRIDQIAEVHRLLRDDPDSRRIIVNAWNVAELKDMALTPCHAMFQFYTTVLTTQERIEMAPLTDRERQAIMYQDEEGRVAWLAELNVPLRSISCKLYQRSADMFLGVPFNIASYALLTLMFGKIHNMAPGMFIWSGGDVHLYDNHRDQAKILLGRIKSTSTPHVRIKRTPNNVWDFKVEDFELIGYMPQEKIPAPVAV